MSTPKLTQDCLDALAADLDGELVCPGDEAYEGARSVWSGLIDRRPAVIARCAGTQDVRAAVNFARERDLLVSVRGGAHSAPGHSTCDDGIVIDLTPLKAVAVDPEARTAIVGAGVTWGELDTATQEHGLAVTGGRVSTTGVAGLTLGSGSGWLGRMYGMTCQSLLGAEVVTAAGEIVRCSDQENFDLLWGLRGGGGNFGVVTKFVFRLHPVGPIVYAGQILHPREAAKDLLRFYRDFMAQAPDEVGGGLALITAPPLDFIPEAARGKPVAGVTVLYVGDPSEGERAFASLLEWGDPLLTMVQPMPYTAVQSMIDAGAPYGIREYFKIDYLGDLSDEAVDAMVDQVNTGTSPFTQVVLEPLGGEMDRADQSRMALGCPSAGWSYHCLNMWMDPAQDEEQMQWARDFAAVMQPHSLGQALPNFISADEGEARLKAAYGTEKYERLVALKGTYDPANLFRLNQNIRPSAGGNGAPG